MTIKILLTILTMVASFFNSGGDEFYVKEYFIITEVSQGEIRGEIVFSTYDEEMTGEGIYLDKTYKGFKSLKDVKVNEVIEVTYKKTDYENSIWDNIIKAKVIR